MGWCVYVYAALLGLTLLSLSMVSCRDPGLVERIIDEEACGAGFVWNEQVGSFRPADARYCGECKVMIDNYDHFCPWTGTGIGNNNMCCFKIFVSLVLSLCVCSII